MQEERIIEGEMLEERKRWGRENTWDTVAQDVLPFVSEGVSRPQ